MVQNLKENCHHDHIPFNLKGKEVGDLVKQKIFKLRAQRGKVMVGDRIYVVGSIVNQSITLG